MRQKFPKVQRLLRRKEFQAMHQAPFRYIGKRIVVEMRTNTKSFCRLGITVSKKYGKSHLRNRFKRLVREVYRTNNHQFLQGFDIHVKPRKSSLILTSLEIDEEFKRAYEQTLVL